MNRHGALRMCGIVAAVVDYAHFGGWPVNPEVNTMVVTMESVSGLDSFASTKKQLILCMQVHLSLQRAVQPQTGKV